jgi:SAM-dependent methyltransferase
MDSTSADAGAEPSASAAELEQGGFYVQDVDFRSGINGQQSPLWMAITAAVGGIVPPAVDGAFTYCDLGCGDGTTVNALAELYPQATFYGVDFNAGHIATARETAAHCGLDNVQFIQAPFRELARHDLPAFDFVGMNGIYAWLEDAEVRAARAFLKDRLRPGGLFYVEYTSLPGKVSVQPLWSLIQWLVPPKEGEDSRERARRGLDLTEALAKRGMAYLNAHRPAANGAQSYVRGRKQDSYRVDHFAHNAMASGFRPRYFTEMADEMAEAGLTYAGRTELARNEIQLCVPPAQVPTFQDFKDDVRAVELLKDYIRNEQQRHDVFAKDAEPDRAAADAWLDRNLALAARTPPSGVRRAIATMGNHRVPLRGPAYEAVIEAAERGGATPEQVAQSSGVPLERVRRAAVRLLASNQFIPCRREVRPDVPDVAEIGGLAVTGEINRRTLSLAVERLTQNQLTSPVAGGPAIPVSAIEAVILQGVTETGAFDRGLEQAQATLADRTARLPVPSGRKPAKDISRDELQQVLDAMRGRKIHNMLRWRIAEER